MITLQLPAGQQRHQPPQKGANISDGDWSPPRHRHPEYPAHIRRGFIRMLQPTIPAANIDHMNNGLTFHTHLCPLKRSLITINRHQSPGGRLLIREALCRSPSTPTGTLHHLSSPGLLSLLNTIKLREENIQAILCHTQTKHYSMQLDYSAPY